MSGNVTLVSNATPPVPVGVTATPLVVSVAAGTAVVGKVQIDQTTPGTTNGVVINSGTVSITDISNAEYETVAASQTAQVLGGAGAVGDYLSGLLVTPATTSPGNVIILDNATSITVFTGGASSVSNLVPFFIPVGARSVSGAWKVTTGANVSVIGVGNFT
jgi:hypothetical protein